MALSLDEYLTRFKEDFQSRTKTRAFSIDGLTIDIFPGVFPSDSPLTLSTQSIIWALKKEIASGKLVEGKKKFLDIGTGAGAFALYLAKIFPKASITAVDNDEI